MTDNALPAIERADADTIAVPRLLNAEQLAAVMKIDKRHLRRLVHEGTFPEPIRLGRFVRWDARDYLAFLDAQRARSKEREAKRKRGRG